MIQQIRKKFPYAFLIVILVLIAFLYFCFIIVLMLNLKVWSTASTVIFMIIYHIVLGMLLWSIYQSIHQDPGRVPLQWGFQEDNRTKKYCLICHVFKPERTHHCSACNRCVLNMDHHCPWINSCIGFYNRKSFILMLIYTNLATLLNLLAFIFSVPSIIHLLKNSSAHIIVNLVVVTLATILNCIVFATIFSFLKFHLQLIFTNMTTLETLQLKRQGKDPNTHRSIYNLGNYNNWRQVFGKNWLIWPLPIFLSDEGPSGDGILWPKREFNIL